MKSKRFWGLFATSLLALLIIPLTLWSVKNLRFENRKRAAEKISEKPVQKPEYKEGEIVIKLKFPLSNEVSLDRQPIAFDTLGPKILPDVLKTMHQKYKIKTIEKVFKGAQSPEKELGKLKQKYSSELTHGLRKINEKELLKIDLSRTYKISFDKRTPVEEIIQMLILNPEVEYVEPNYLYKAQPIPNDPFFLDNYPNNISGRDPSWNPAYDYQWNLKIMGDPDLAWNIATGSPDILVAVIDTGIDYIHEELGGCTLSQVNDNQCLLVSPGYDFINNDNNPLDDNGHGTAVSGIISAATNNGKGLAGINWQTKIIPVKVLSSSGEGTLDIVASGINFAVLNGARVINMSIGSIYPEPTISETLKDALDYAFNTNVVLVAAAGNSNSDVALGYYPANYQYVISVAATDEKDQKSSYSNYGKIEVAAPGGTIPYNLLSLNAHDPASPSSYLNLGGLPVAGSYLRVAGTSLASPHVTGLASLVLAKNPSLTNLQVKSIIEANADCHLCTGYPGNDQNYGYGRITLNSTLSQINANLIPPVAEIYSPKRNEPITGTYSIIGTAEAQNFQNYRLSVGLGQNPSTFTTEGLTLNNNGMVPVNNNLLGTLDSSLYFGKILTAKLEVLDQTGLKKEKYVTFSVLSPLLPSGDNIVVDDSPATSLTPAGAFDSSNNYYVVWADARNSSQTGSDIYFSKSTDRGLTFSQNQLLTVNQYERSAYHPNIITHNHDIYVVFESLLPDNGGKIFVKKSSDSGSSFATTAVLDIPQMTKPNLQGRFKEIKLDIFGNYLYLTWQAGKSSDNNLYVYFSRFNLQNNSFEETKILSTIINNSQEFPAQPSLVTDSNGRIYIVWTEQEAPNSWYSLLLAKSTDNGSTFDTPKKIVTRQYVDSQWLSLLGIDKNKNIIYLTFAATSPESWARDVWITKSTDAGNTFADPVNLTKGQLHNPFKSAYFQSPVIVNSQGEVFVGIRNINQGETYYIHSDSSLSSVSELNLISPNSTDSIALKIHLVATGNTDIFALYDFGRQEINILSRRIGSIPLTPIPTPTIGFGQAVKFSPDATNPCAYISVPASGKLLMAYNFTLEFFFKPDAKMLDPNLGAVMRPIVTKKAVLSSSSNWGAYNLTIESTRKTLRNFFVLQRPDTSYTSVISPQGIIQLTANNWHFCKLLKQGNQISLYINGQLDSQINVTNEPLLTDQSLTPLLIGSWQPKDSQICVYGIYSGEFDELRLSNIARPEISIPSAPFTPDENTMALYHFDGNADDSSGNSLNGTINGPVSFINFVTSTVNRPAPTLLPQPTATPAKDSTPPTISISRPTNQSTVKKKASVKIVALASDNPGGSGMSNVKFYINNSLVLTDKLSPYEYLWTAPNKKGTYKITAKAFDKAGNSSTSSITVTVK